VVGFDATSIKNIAVVVDDQLSGSATASGALTIAVNGLFYSPAINPGTGPVSDFSGLNPKPTASGMAPAGHNTVTSFTQTSTNQYSFNYDLTNGVAADFSRWAGSLIGFGTGSLDLSGQDLVLGVSGTGTSKIKVELISGTGANEKKVVIVLQGLTGSNQFYRITKAMADAAGVVGFDATSIKNIAVVVDDQLSGSATASGALTIAVNGLFYRAVVPGTAYNQANLTTLPSNPTVSSAHGAVSGVVDTSTITATQISATTVQVTSNVPTQGNFTFTSIVFPTAGVDLGNSVTLAFSGTSGKMLKLEFVNTSNVKKEFLVPLSTGELNYTFDLTGFVGPIGQINIVADEVGTTNYVLETKGLAFTPPIPVVSGAAFNQVALTTLPSNPTVSSAHGAVSGVVDTSTITATQISATTVQVTSNVPTQGNFTFTSVNFPTAGVNLGNSVTLAFSGTSGKMLKLEFVDTSNVKKLFLVPLSTGELNYTFDLTGFAGPITAINIVADEIGTTNYVLETKGLAFTPVITTATTNALTNLGGASISEMEPAGNNTVTAFSQTSAGAASFTYNLANGTGNNRWAGSLISFVNNFNLTTQNLVIAGSDAGSSYYKLELIDAQNDKVALRVNVDGRIEVTNALAQAANVAAFNADQIRFLAIVVDDPNATVGTLSITTSGLVYTPILAGATYNQSLMTSLAASPAAASGSGNTVSGQPAAIMRMTQNSADEFEYDYDLGSSGTSFTFVRIAGGDFVGGVFQGTLMTLPSQLVIAAQGSSGGRVQVKLHDADQAEAVFILDLEPFLQNFTLNAASGNVPVWFDWSRVADIIFVQDSTIGSALSNDYVKIQAKGMAYTAPLPNVAFEANRATLVQNGLNYFDVGVGVDTVTHLPYDNMGPGGALPGRYTQPTLIGFYLQILGDVVLGKIDNGMTRSQALTEINTVMTNLLSIQSAPYSWHGLIPWLNLDPLDLSTDIIALGDNANLSQSIAVTVGALESTGLSGADLTAAQQISTKADQYLNNQAVGYAAFVDNNFGIFHAAFDISTGEFSAYIDRVSNEFRGAVAFLATYYAGVPDSVFNNLAITTNSSYIDRNGQAVENLAPWDGAAFQIFWPELRNEESTYIGFRNALYNMLATQLDYAYQNRIPGILSTSLTPEGSYSSTGIPQMAEANMVPNTTNSIVGDSGSTYALAAAMGIDRNAVLGWLNSINNLFGMMGDYGFYDSARSGSEINNRFIGIDVASMVLGLAGNGPDDFTTYLRNRGMEDNYNQLYDHMSQQMAIDRTGSGLPNTPEFPDRSLAVFGHIASEGAINYIHTIPPVTKPPTPPETTLIYGVRLAYTDLQGVDGGHFWKLSQPYNAQANQLILNYSAVDSPQFVRIELKDGAGLLLYQTTVALEQGAKFARLVVDLPNQAALANVQEIDLVVDAQEGGDATGDFTIQAIDFQHVPSAPVVGFTAQPGSPAVTVLPVNSASVSGVAQLGSSSSNSTLQHIFGTNFFQLHFDLTNANAFAGIVLNFDPNHNGSSVNLSAVPLIFGINATSSVAKNVKIEIEDVHGNTYTTSNTDIVSSGYYKFLASLAAGRVDLSHVKSIKFVVDQYSVASASGTVGDLQLEIGGLQ
jgi:hypothetical protein